MLLIDYCLQALTIFNFRIIIWVHNKYITWFLVTGMLAYIGTIIFGMLSLFTVTYVSSNDSP